MVWLFGATFSSGTSRDDIFGPERFMNSKDIVLVTVNYRIGVFGFLSLGIDTCPGNQVEISITYLCQKSKYNIYLLNYFLLILIFFFQIRACGTNTWPFNGLKKTFPILVEIQIMLLFVDMVLDLFVLRIIYFLPNLLDYFIELFLCQEHWLLHYFGQLIIQ